MSIKFTSDQMADGFVQSDAEFAAWYIKDVMEPHQPEFYHVLTPEGRVDRVLRGRTLARAHGLQQTNAQAYFIGMMFDIGPDFYRFAGFKEALARTDLDELPRVRQFLDGTVTDKQAVFAIQNASDKHWWTEPEEING